MLTPRALFLELGGFDEEAFAVSYNDVDYCLKLGDEGHRVVYCGEAELYHHQGFTRGSGTTSERERAALASVTVTVPTLITARISGSMGSASQSNLASSLPSP